MKASDSEDLNMKARQTLEEAVKNREPHFIITDDHEIIGNLIEIVYEAGSGDTLARRTLDKRACARMIEKLIQPLIRRPQGHDVSYTFTTSDALGSSIPLREVVKAKRAYPKHDPDKWDRPNGYWVAGHGYHQ